MVLTLGFLKLHKTSLLHIALMWLLMKTPSSMSINCSKYCLKAENNNSTLVIL